METLLQPSQSVPQPAQAPASGGGSGNGSRPVPPCGGPIVLALTPDELAALGLSSPPAPGSELAASALAVVRPPSGADGVVLELTLTALQDTGRAPGQGGRDGSAGGSGGGSEQEAFFRSLFAGNG